MICIMLWNTATVAHANIISYDMCLIVAGHWSVLTLYPLVYFRDTGIRHTIASVTRKSHTEGKIRPWAS